jgi:UDP-N-acetylmuramoylalanine--D-glutamate ligase
VTEPYTRRHVVVAGLGVSGPPVARALLDRGARVTVVEGRSGAAEHAAARALESAGAQVRLGDAETWVDGADLVVTSPGWRPQHPLLVAASAAGVEVIGEPELAWRLRGPGAAPWLALTGTNGKTTTVGMLESILRAAGLNAVAAGNVGLPLVEAVLAKPAYDVLAVELSSFQLHWSHSLVPHAAAVLNLADDHTDWHGSFEAYVEDKCRIWAAGSVAIGNADDPQTLARLPAQGRTFSLDGDADYVVRGDSLVEARTGERLAGVADVRLPGAHNLANALAAAALARTLDVSPAAVHEGLRAFGPGHHRNEVVAEGGGVTWVDDSKATNPHAAAASLAAYPSVVWIAGGLLKGARVDDLVVEQAHRLRGVVLIGADRAAIAEALARHAPDVPVVDVAATDTEGMDVAVRAAARLARPGDTVLLAPSAASMDMFRDYAERGDRFAAAARRAAGGAA